MPRPRPMDEGGEEIVGLKDDGRKRDVVVRGADCGEKCAGEERVMGEREGDE